MAIPIVPRDEFVLNTSWEDLTASRPNFTFCHTDEVDKIFRGPPANPVVVSADSDAGVFLQATAHPNEDLQKMAYAGIDWDKVGAERRQYVQIPLGPACELARCRPSDRYVVKMDRFSFGTFAEIPSWVKLWYTTNPGLPHGHDRRIRWLPFGLNHHGEGKDILPGFARHHEKDKPGLLYVNFSPNTIERIQLLDHFRRCPWATVRQGELPVQQFFHEAASHKFVLAPHGNGLDCYRTLESIYLGSIPVLPTSSLAHHYLEADLPVMSCKNFFSLTQQMLERAWDSMYAREPFDMSTALLSHWRKEFSRCSA